jgi:GNAT superfamily N-acetyltransferase
LCFALLDGDRQVGFARVISDHATIAYLGDVFVLPEYRGRGLAKWLVECVTSHSELQGLRRWILATSDAHGLYEKFGFTPLKNPGNFMERHDPTVYAVRER